MPQPLHSISPELERVLKQSERVLRTIWGLMLALSIFFVALAYRISQEAAPLTPRPELDTARSLLVFIAVGMGTLSFFIYKNYPSVKQLRLLLSREVDSPGASAELPSSAQAPHLDSFLKSLPPHERKLLRLPGLVALPSVVCFSLNEGICVLALFLAQLSQGQIQQVYPLLAAGIGLQVIMRPRLRVHLTRALRLVQSSSSLGNPVVRIS
jgi:hypothetical protein